MSHSTTGAVRDGPVRAAATGTATAASRTRIFGLTAVLLLGLGGVDRHRHRQRDQRVGDLHAEAGRAVDVQRSVEAARYDLLWAANWQNITAWNARVDGGEVAAAPDGDNVADYRDGAEGFEQLFTIDRSLLDADGRGQPRRRSRRTGRR